MNSVASKIKSEIEQAPELTIWHCQDFVLYGKATNIKMALSRLASTGFLKRALDGFYYRPCIDENSGREKEPSPHELAKKIASVFHWSIVPTGDLVLTTLGLSNEAPSVYEYSSDGPYRDYKALGSTIRFKHRSPRFIKDMSPLTAFFIEALKALRVDGITEDDIDALSRNLSQKEILTILKEARSAPAWVYECALRVKDKIKEKY